MTVSQRFSPLTTGGMSFAALVLAGCSWFESSASVEGELTGDAAADAPADGPSDAKSDAPTDASADADAGSDAPASDTGDGGSAAVAANAPSPTGGSCTYDAGPTPAPDAGAVCGDGYRAPSEECDDGLGNASTRRGCSPTCKVLDELAVAQLGSDGGVSNAPHVLGGGRHPLAASTSTFAVAYFEPQSVPPALSLATFTAKGVPGAVVSAFNAPLTVLPASNPVVADLGCDRYAAAWTDYGGDGDELGVAMTVVQPGGPPSGAPAFANTTTAFSQFDPDIIATGGQVIVAWVDNSNAATQPDVRFRTFDATTLAPTSGEQTLAATADSEADVALAPFAGSWAAAWRDDANGLETIRVHAGSTEWTVGPAFLPGPSAGKPVLAQLDATRLLVAYPVGTPPVASTLDAGASDAGTRDGASGDGAAADGTTAPAASAMGSKVQLAVLDLAAPGNVTGVDLAATVTSAVGLSQSQPNLVTFSGNVYLAWRTDAMSSDPNGEELWLKALSWDGTTVSMSASEAPLPRMAADRKGDQRNVGLAASTLPPGGAVVSAWDDLGKTLSGGEGNGDVVVQLLPVAPKPPPNVAFVSSRVYPNANFGGLAGADRECQTMAQNANLAGTFIAYLATSTASAGSRLQSARGWVRSDGQPVADTLQQLTAGNLWYPILLDETGQPIAGNPYVLTATKFDGSPDSANTCSDWTSTDPLGVPNDGNPWAGYSGWQSAGNVSCTGNGALFRLYCFQNTQNVVLAPPRAQGRFAFPTHNPWAPSGGIAAADAQCQAEATAAGLPGTYLALLSTSAASASSRFDLTGPTWVRPDGVLVFAQASDLASLSFVAPIAVSADRALRLGNYYVWAGSSAITAPGTTSTTCNDWTSHATPDAGSPLPLLTLGGFTRFARGSIWGFTAIGCDFAGSLVYCLQQ